MDLRVAAYAVIERRGKILLTHWRRGHLHGWTLPGGGIEAGEDPRDTVVREVLEETGLNAKVGRLIGVDSRVMIREEVPEGTAPELHTIRIVYRATVQDGPLRHEIGGSSDEARWVPLAEISSLKTLSLVQTGLRFAGISRRGGGSSGGSKSGAPKSGSQKSGGQKQSGSKQGNAKASKSGSAKSGRSRQRNRGGNGGANKSASQGPSTQDN